MNSIASGQDVSFFIRISSIPLIFQIISEKHLLSGVGLGGIEIIEDEVITAYIRAGFSKNLIKGSNANRIASYIFSSIIYFGIIAGTVFYLILYRLLSLKNISNIFIFCIIFIVFGFFEGGLVTARVWIFVFSLVFILSNNIKGFKLKT